MDCTANLHDDVWILSLSSTAICRYIVLHSTTICRYCSRTRQQYPDIVFELDSNMQILSCTRIVISFNFFNPCMSFFNSFESKLVLKLTPHSG